MLVRDAGLCGLKVLTAAQYPDDRGWFAETFNRRDFLAAGLPGEWAQDNQSHSRHGVLRGLHFQVTQPQGKLVRVLAGLVWDVVVDLRRHSPDFGRWFGMDLAAPSVTGGIDMLWIPEGFAHGFLVLSESAEVGYKVTRPYDPEGQQTLRWDDPEVGIEWPFSRLQTSAPILSAKDAAGLSLAQLSLF